MKQLLTVSLLVVFLTSSCMVSKEQVGRYNEIEGNTKVYEINKDAYLFWNLIPLRRTDKKLPIKDYEKIVKRSFLDGVVLIGSIGIVSFYTVKIKIKEPEEAPKTTE